ncbi:metalloregulator ArsR/SmtB family transcription factor [Eubacteriales bacterium OttesenSCG-928-K08]|nr:metalloregulator ArsR/SmtB family transcription factor [Eubacteriales bacterium OttesenSCG-928-K08]
MENVNHKCSCDAHRGIVGEIKQAMPEAPLLYDLADFFKAIGDSTRIQILWALEKSELCVGDLADLLNMTTSAVSHQLKTLRTAKLIRFRKEGKNVYYSLDDAHVHEILSTAFAHVKER